MSKISQTLFPVQPAIGPALGQAARITALAGLLALSACQAGLDGLSVDEKHNVPIASKLINKMKAYGMKPSSPIMMRIFKEENVLEVWKQADTGRYALLETFEICKWSGKLGPKFKEGDRQAPEGFYTVNRHQLNPRSQYHLSFNMGFPNSYDRAHGRTGSHLMVHGDCSSAGCYSMTDELVQDIYALAREALEGGQERFQIQAFPFRMTPENMAKHASSPHFDFWQMLKQGYDHFEITRVPPKINTCEKRYVFNTQSSQPYPTSGTCPKMEMPASLALAYTKRKNEHRAAFEALMAKQEGRKPAELKPLTVSAALPGVIVNLPEPEVPETPAAPLPKSEPAQASPPTASPIATGSTPPPASTASAPRPPEAGQNANNAKPGKDPFLLEANALN